MVSSYLENNAHKLLRFYVQSNILIIILICFSVFIIIIKYACFDMCVCIFVCMCVCISYVLCVYVFMCVRVYVYICVYSCTYLICEEYYIEIPVFRSPKYIWN